MSGLRRHLVRHVLPALIAAAGLVTALDNADWPSVHWSPPRLTLACSVLPFVAGLALAFLARWGENDDYTRLKLEKTLRPILATPLGAAIEECGGQWRGV